MSFPQRSRPSAPRRQFLRGVVVSWPGLVPLALGGRGEAADVPLTILCSGPAGSIPDFVARAVGARVTAVRGRAAVVINRPGAGGRMSVDALRAAPVDGSTWLLAQGAIATLYPLLFRTLSYDPAVDLQPVAMACEMPLALAVGAAVPGEVIGLADFLAWGRRYPLALNVGSPGVGTLPHLLEALLFRDAGLAWQHVPYSGGPPALADLLGGHVAALVLPQALLRQHHVARRIRVLAMSGSGRSVGLPGVPTFVELGHPALVIKEWFAFFAPGRTTAATVARACAIVGDAIASADVRATFEQAGMTPTASSPVDLTRRIAAEQQAWRPVLRELDLHVD